MNKRYHQFNTKRKIKKLTAIELEDCSKLADKVLYTGNSEHKKNPGDFGLTPPSGARPRKSLCDTVNIFSKKTHSNFFNLACVEGLSVSNLMEIGLKSFGQSLIKVSRWKRSLRTGKRVNIMVTRCQNQIP